MGREVVAGACLLAAGSAAAAYAVRGRTSQAFGKSVWRGPDTGRRIALTFDDGPSPSTPSVLDLLSRYSARATFFQCGAHASRLSAVARAVADASHEIGNHTQNHPLLAMRSRDFVIGQIGDAQRAILDATGQAPKLFRAPYGVRWFGVAEAQRQFGLLGVMWSVIGRDWTLGPNAIAQRVLGSVSAGSIICLHDGREMQADPDISATVEALALVLPALIDQGFELVTVSELLRVHPVE